MAFFIALLRYGNINRTYNLCFRRLFLGRKKSR